MNNKIKTIYFNYKIFIMTIEDSKEVYNIALFCIVSRNNKYDIQEIISSLKAIVETYDDILDSQNEIISILSNNELISDYFLLLTLIINRISNKIYTLINLLIKIDTYENKKLVSDMNNIFDLTDHLLKNAKYILDCIEPLYYRISDEK